MESVLVLLLLNLHHVITELIMYDPYIQQLSNQTKPHLVHKLNYQFDTENNLRKPLEVFCLCFLNVIFQMWKLNCHFSYSIVGMFEV